MAITATVILDSIAPGAPRLTTVQYRAPRSILAEINTHRTFCLAGDTVLTFDLPAGSKDGKYRRGFTMRLDEFVDKWYNGAAPRLNNPRVKLDFGLLDQEKAYSARELAEIFGVSKTNINRACALGILAGSKEKPWGWLIKGRDFMAYRDSLPVSNRQPMRERLEAMQIRQFNEDTGRIQTSTVKNCFLSGVKDLFVVSAGKFRVVGSADHLVNTTEGWLRIADIAPGVTEVLVQRRGKLGRDEVDPVRLKKIDGRWRSTWQKGIRLELQAKHEGCQKCASTEALEVHHVIPVHVDPSKAFEESNAQLLCRACHKKEHAVQGWQGDTYLYADSVVVDSIDYRGQEQTYDLEIAGKYPNFLANGVVVHNSRNARSSRAVPTDRLLEEVCNDTFIPIWTRNQPGMQGREVITGGEADDLTAWWLSTRDEVLYAANRMLKHRPHKQNINRLLEPWMWVDGLISATEWDNFFALRCHPDAEPHMQLLAEAIRTALAESAPTECPAGHWRIPYIGRSDATEAEAVGPSYWPLASAARCARVSYRPFDGATSVHDDYLKGLAMSQARPLHASPFEHVARPMLPGERQLGNLIGWRQYRHELEGAV